MEKLLELGDIELIPREINSGWGNGRVDYFVDSPEEVTGINKSLPIFTSPMEAVVGVDNWKTYQDRGIKPILPRTVNLETRLDACGYIFSAFSIQEVVDNFLNRNMTSSNVQFHVCIDSGNGHDSNLLSLGQKLKQMYRGQMILMGGNIGNPQTYVSYSRSGFDYVRVGISSGSLVKKKKFGFHYPMASLLGSISQIKKLNKQQLRDVKVIADGGITCHSDILKAVAMGADYVMIGREFAKLLEASGTIYKRTIKPDPEPNILEEVKNPEKLLSLSTIEIRELDLVRQYFGNTSPEMQALRNGYQRYSDWIQENPKVKISDSEWIWVEVMDSLDSWIKDFKECVSYGFMISDSKNWNDFKEKVLYGRTK